MFYSDILQLGFYHINKTGGTSIRETLSRYCPGEIAVVLNDGVIRTDNLTKVGSSLIKHEPLRNKIRTLGKKFDELTVLTTVRNPFARYVSMYHHRRQNLSPSLYFVQEARGLEFKVWLMKILEDDVPGEYYARPISEFLHEGDIPENLVIFKLEEIDVYMTRFLAENFGIRISQFDRRNRTFHRPSLEYYDDETFDIIREKERWVLSTYYPQIYQRRI